MDVYYPHHTYNVKDSVTSLRQWPSENSGSLWPQNFTDYAHLTRHAVVMGSTWGMLVPAAILMARFRNKKGWWFQLHRALATASLVLVVVGAVLGRRLRLTHPPVTTAGTLHKLLGYTALTFICLQALSALLWRPHGSHSFKPTWNKVHAKWGKATMAVGATAVCLGIHVAGVGWPWYLVYALLTGSILGTAYYMDPLKYKKAAAKPSQDGTAHTNGHASLSSSGSIKESAGGLIPWILNRSQVGTKQA
ncbi:hypothetical protein ABBQ32_010572 [Trebouxia sp. C0010 RCD-2024]